MQTPNLSGTGVATWMPDVPLVSVILPVAGCPAELAQAIASVICQSWPNWELLIVYDGEGDRIERLAAQFEDPRIRVLNCLPPKGRGAARQTGLEACRGQFIAFVDADDWMLGDRLERQVDMLVSRPDAILVSGGIIVIGPNENPVGMRKMAPAGLHLAPDGIVDSPVLNAASMLRASPARSVGYDVRFKHSEDSEFMVRYLRGRQYHVDNQPVYAYREYQSFNKIKQRRALGYVLKRHLKHAPGLLKKTRFFTRWLIKRVLYELIFIYPGWVWLLSRRTVPLAESELKALRQSESDIFHRLHEARVQVPAQGHGTA